MTLYFKHHSFLLHVTVAQCPFIDAHFAHMIMKVLSDTTVILRCGGNAESAFEAIHQEPGKQPVSEAQSSGNGEPIELQAYKLAVLLQHEDTRATRSDHNKTALQGK